MGDLWFSAVCFFFLFFLNFPSDQKHLFDLVSRPIGRMLCPLTPTLSKTAQADHFYLMATSDNNWGTDPWAEPRQGQII